MEIFESELMKRIEYHNNKRKGAFGSLKENYTYYYDACRLDIKQICNSFNAGNYKFHKVKLKKIPKNRGGERTIFLMNVGDSLIQDTALHIFENNNSDLFPRCAYAYRNGYGPNRMVKNIYEVMQEKDIHFMLHVDSKKLVDSIDLQILNGLIDEHIEDIQFKALLKGYISHERLKETDSYYFPEDKGIYAGGALTGFLMNLYFINFDKLAMDYLDAVYYYRYGDDIFAFSDNVENLMTAYKFYEKYLTEELRLDVYKLCDNNKTAIIPLDADGYFHFYDYSFNKNEIRIREFIVNKILEDTSNIVHNYNLLEAINAINYYFVKSFRLEEEFLPDCYFRCFSICTCISQFTYLDNQIRKILEKRFGKNKRTYQVIKNELLSTKFLYYKFKKSQRKYSNLSSR